MNNNSKSGWLNLVYRDYYSYSSWHSRLIDILSNNYGNDIFSDININCYTKYWINCTIRVPTISFPYLNCWKFWHKFLKIQMYYVVSCCWKVSSFCRFFSSWVHLGTIYWFSAYIDTNISIYFIYFVNEYLPKWHCQTDLEAGGS